MYEVLVLKAKAMPEIRKKFVKSEKIREIREKCRENNIFYAKSIEFTKNRTNAIFS